MLSVQGPTGLDGQGVQGFQGIQGISPPYVGSDIDILGHSQTASDAYRGGRLYRYTIWSGSIPVAGGANSSITFTIGIPAYFMIRAVAINLPAYNGAGTLAVGVEWKIVHGGQYFENLRTTNGNLIFGTGGSVGTRYLGSIDSDDFTTAERLVAIKYSWTTQNASGNLRPYGTFLDIYGTKSSNYKYPGGAPPGNVYYLISQSSFSTTNINVTTLSGYVAGGTNNITIEIAQGVQLVGSQGTTPYYPKYKFLFIDITVDKAIAATYDGLDALYIYGGSSTDNITLINRGSIMGRGGTGGVGVFEGNPILGNTYAWYGGNGGRGLVASNSNSVKLYNYGIIGGGGGGGGGYVKYYTDFFVGDGGPTAQGGGGGGAGFGKGGGGGIYYDNPGNDGTLTAGGLSENGSGAGGAPTKSGGSGSLGGKLTLSGGFGGTSLGGNTTTILNQGTIY